MDTIYYTANFRTVKVAGGEDQVRVYLVPEARSTQGQGSPRRAESSRPTEGQGGPRATRPTKGKGEVVNLEMARARVERKNAWKALVDAAWG